jgi:hypothetical protein
MITTTANDQKPTGSQIGQDMYSASQNVFFSYMSGGDDSIASCLVQDSNVSHTITC